jgi:hypothetical protein
MSIEIFNNTLLKILFRQGTDNERQNIIFNSGEPAFTTDTNRLYIGNGVLSGGVSVTTKNHIPLTNFYSLSNTYS